MKRVQRYVFLFALVFAIGISADTKAQSVRQDPNQPSQINATEGQVTANPGTTRQESVQPSTTTAAKSTNPGAFDNNAPKAVTAAPAMTGNVAVEKAIPAKDANATTASGDVTSPKGANLVDFKSQFPTSTEGMSQETVNAYKKVYQLYAELVSNPSDEMATNMKMEVIMQALENLNSSSK
jgi:hypothetical protein